MTTQFEKKQITLLVSIIMGLLTLTAGGVGWLIIENARRMDKQDSKIERIEARLTDVENISRNIVEAYNGKVDRDKAQDIAIEKQRDEIMELWKCTKRSGSAQSLTIKE